jgi:hypothetical protein
MQQPDIDAAWSDEDGVFYFQAKQRPRPDLTPDN